MLTLDDLRPYQLGAIDAVGNNWALGKSTLVAAPTGAGKTHMLCGLVHALKLRTKGTPQHGFRTIVTVHRNALVDQVVERMLLFGLDAGASERNNVYVTTIQSLYDSPPTQRALVIVDEAHRSVAGKYWPIINQLRAGGAWLAGFTATPERMDQNDPVPGVFDTGYVAVSAQELIDNGHLVRPRFIDYEYQMGTANGYLGEPGDIPDCGKAHTDILGIWAKYASDRKTVIFTRTISEAQGLTLTARRWGYDADFVSGTRRQGAISTAEAKLRLERGQTQIIVNAMKWIEGVDVPALSAVVMARRTESSLLATQAIGRGLRPYPGKSDCIVLCLAGVPEYYDLRDWSVTPA